ncbi:MAG TPA: hypothetical protein PK867_16290, partial [Pirellulales bacterium]|nr:hypothetical protein [Pirellulales bacterium]
LANPAAHLRRLAQVAPLVALHTHGCQRPETSDGGNEGLWWTEGGWDAERDGVGERSFWPTRASLREMASNAGFGCETVWDRDVNEHAWVGYYFLRRRA